MIDEIKKKKGGQYMTDWCIIPKFARRGWGNHKKFSQDIWCPGRGSNRALPLTPLYKCWKFLLHQRLQWNRLLWFSGMITQYRDRHFSRCLSTAHKLRIYHVLLDNKQPILAQFMLSLTSQVTVREINVAVGS